MTTTSKMAKRLFDIVLSALGLMLLSPVMLIIAIWVKLDSPGPVFFRQERIGRHGVTFRIHKFRTMAHGRQGALITVGADRRITKAGAWLRRTKLDELPQLIDVLKGDMSLVGPRPEVPRYVAMYPAGLRDKVLSVRPGITDVASLEYRNESERLALATDPEQEYVNVVMPAKLLLAARYVEMSSLWFDAKLILRTVRQLWWRPR